MNNKSAKYGKELFELAVNENDILECRKLLSENKELLDSLKNPAVEVSEKYKVIEQLFPPTLTDYFKSLADENIYSSIDDIFDAYNVLYRKENNIVAAVLTYALPPNEKEVEKIINFVKETYNAEEVILEQKEDKSLIGGNILQVEDHVYVKSIRSNFEEIKRNLKHAISQKSDSQDVVSVLKENIENYETKMQVEESGVITYIGDGIATAYGLSHVMYGEIVAFENGVKGMVQDIRKDEVGIVLLGQEKGLKEGSRVMRTGKRAGVPVGEAMIGRIVNALGEPIDGKGTINAEDYRPIENEAPGIIERKKVNVPLETGILAIDAMFPIGRGQRELIIGDRQTGKTSLAIDAILNQKGKDVICIYVAIGQKASTVAKVASNLERYGAMEYSIVVAATASDVAPLQYIAPYSGTSMAEYFMYKGKDVLIVYDDLSKHAVAYRALALLLERSPGREAYPGDVFYLHSRLLERSCRLQPEYGGGSITSLPIIETQAGDISAYIPTNVISITDGQIFMESNLFFSGVRPAVNVGLSVSRVGGDAQTKAMKKAAGSLRIDLAQYREMEVFTQFSSDLDAGTMEQLQHGRILIELLKQPLYEPKSLADQIITLYAATNKLLTDVPHKDLIKFMKNLLEEFNDNHSEIISEINTKKVLSDELAQNILDITKEFKSR